MAAKLAITSSSFTTTTATTTTNKLLLSSPCLSNTILFSSRPKQNSFKISAKLGGGEEELKPGEKKKFISKEQEPEQYWQTAGEREGENPMATPLPYIIIFGMSTPFIILAIAFANGWIKMPIR